MGGQEIVLIVPLLVIYVAGQKNRHPLVWGLLSLLIVGPLFALIALAAVPSRADDEAAVDDETAARMRRM